MYKNVVICPIGTQSLHRLWCTDNRQFDVILIAYNKDAWNTYKRDGDTCYYQKGYKYPLIKDYLNHEGLNYENYCFIDDDTGIDADGLNQCFELMENSGIKVLHPAVEPKNQPNVIINPNPDTEYRFTNWTEIQCLFMSKDYLSQVYEHFDLNTSGWGLPNLFYTKTQIPYCIYDLVTVMHCRGTNTGIDPLYKDIETAYNELEDALKNIPHENGKVLSFKLRNLLSFPIIFNQEKASYLPDCIESLPIDSEIVLIETIQDEEKEGLQDVQTAKNRVFARYYYKEWDYSKARNAAKSLCTKPIIFSIDSDERLSAHQHTSIIKAALDLYKSDFVGLKVRNISIAEHPEYKGNYLAETCEQVRVFKNIPQLKWQRKMHENIEYSMRENGWQYADSNILIQHTGYDIPNDMLRDKHLNRLKMLLSDNDCHDDEDYLNYIINESARYNYYKELTKGK